MSLFAFIKEHIAILDVISEFVQLRAAGGYWKGSCPFHSEKDASFTVSPDKQIFYCFGCHTSGDVIGFIAKIENMSQKEAADFLIDRYQLQVPTHLAATPTSQKDRDAKERYFAAHKALAEWMHKQLLNNKQALTYVQNRKLTDQTISSFQIGYLPGGAAAINHLVKEMANGGFLLKELIEHGFIVEGKATLFSPFEERIIFPIKNAQGKYSGFGGRIFKPGDERPKYYNSKEADGFEKGKLLFGFDLAKKALQEAQNGFLVEGYLDCITMAQYGYKNTVATLGTACTLDHLKQLSRLIHTLYVLYDGDAAGQKAMLRLTELCWEVNIDLRIIALPANHDPASFLSQNGDLKPFIDNALDIIIFFINATGADFESKPLAHKLAAAEKITTLIARTSDAFKRDLLLHQTAKITQLPFDSLKDFMLKNARKAKHAELQEQPTSENLEDKSIVSAVNSEISILEEKLFSAILSAFKATHKIGLPAYLPQYMSATAQEVFKKLDYFSKSENNNKTSVLVFFDTLEPSEKEWAIRASVRDDGNACQQTLEQLLLRFYRHHWQRIVRDTKQAIMAAQRDNDPQKVQAMLNEFAQIKKGILPTRGLK